LHKLEKGCKIIYLKDTFALSVLLILTAMPAAARSQQEAATPSDTFIYGIEEDPGNDINTITIGDRYGLTLERLLYSPLYNYYGPGDITYLLAERVEVSPTI
jgi:hypothetical protein